MRETKKYIAIKIGDSLTCHQFTQSTSTTKLANIFIFSETCQNYFLLQHGSATSLTIGFYHAVTDLPDFVMIHNSKPGNDATDKILFSFVQRFMAGS